MSAIQGAYELVKYGYHHKKDQSFKPISDWYGGSIQYSSTGYMSVVLRFAENPKEFSEIVSYSGTYKVEGSQIVHHVTHSVRPEYEGEFLTRTFQMKDNILTLEFENTNEFIKFAEWKRLT